ncbi:MAG: transcription elongation factor GreA [Ignavibacteriae bacterium]|nr:transcription elongation factor GreA [Ignavibacteriota bacterium]
MNESNKNNGYVYLTKERLRELERELQELKTKGRSELSQKIGEARSHGDLSENAEYDAAKEEQGLLELRISKMENTLARTRIIESKDLPNDKVYILSNVRLKDLRFGDEVTYLLVAPEEADFDANKISVTSPIGKGLMGKVKGDKVKITVPAGFLEYEILDITR